MEKHKEFKYFSEKMTKLALDAKTCEKSKSRLCSDIKNYLCYCIKRGGNTINDENLQVAYLGVLEGLLLYDGSSPFLFYIRYHIKNELTKNNSVTRGLKPGTLHHYFHNKRHKSRDRLTRFMNPIYLDEGCSRNSSKSKIHFLKDKESNSSYNELLFDLDIASTGNLTEIEKDAFYNCFIVGYSQLEYSKIKGVCRQNANTSVTRAKRKLSIKLKEHGY
ncbi:MAG: hypothetical protein GY679_01635 [Mycoplasma sp.]|nr:hypothetical protein [Mycoplasma sp.]